jgi:hypothetical protein
MTTAPKITYHSLLLNADQPIHRIGKPSFEGENTRSTGTNRWSMKDVPHDHFPRGLSRWPNMVDTLIDKLKKYVESDAFMTEFPTANEEIGSTLSASLLVVTNQVSSHKCPNENAVRSLAVGLATIASAWLIAANPIAYGRTLVHTDGADQNQEKKEKLLADVYLSNNDQGLLYIDCKTRVVLNAHSKYEENMKDGQVDQFSRPPDTEKATGYHAMFGKVRMWTLAGRCLADRPGPDLCHKRSCWGDQMVHLIYGGIVPSDI